VRCPCRLTNRRRWKVFKVNNLPQYAAFKNFIVENGKCYLEGFDYRNEQHWEEILSKKEIAEKLYEVERDQPHPSHHEFQKLLEFLHQRSIHIVILLDNIDYFDIDTQIEIFNHAKLLAANLPALLTPIIAARYSTLRRLKENEPYAYVFFVETLSPVDVRTSNETITHFLKRRIGFIKNFSPRKLFPPDHEVQPYAQQFSHTPELFASNIMKAYDYLTKVLSQNEIVQDLAQWRNESLRATAIEIVDLISRLISNRDPVVRMKDLLELARENKRGGSRRQIRNLLYRHIIVGEIDKNIPKALNVFHNSKTVSQAGEVHFLQLRILEYLRTCQNNQCTYSVLLDFFANLGVYPSEIASAVKSIYRPRGREREGLIMIDLHDAKLEEDIPGHVLIELEPAGRFMVDKLVTTCEYLFWMAMYTDLNLQLFKGVRDVTCVDSDSFKAEIAYKFLSNYVAPKVIKDIDFFVSNSTEPAHRAFQQYLEIFGHPDGTRRELLIERAARSIDNFLVYVEVQQREPLRKQLTNTQNKFREIRERYSA
jgi:hypothetical protein